eukprot:CAMPEP_0168451580 /NCGR_PEP_ID=MMETSP0228-20121227/48707_1 /TAXON_ID=133427 /ORGANISM="Protoceratium reticulatum, Strain CCCM 535 (=CCMP 1889)" /LENGTH=458 /DNA_ID=CAMNT_0008466197 /DNA_START=50 /DNA_END=1426 /DNA_ORIENTATION=+
MASPHFFLFCWAVLLQGTLGMRARDKHRKSLFVTPVAVHGKIRVEGSKLLDEAGQPVRLRGMSLFWSQWGGAFYTAKTVEWLVQDWNVNVVRAAMGVESGGYMTQPQIEMEKVETVVKAAIDAGIYVIISWHDHHADEHLEQAKDFFGTVATKYGHHSNVLFEPFPEPEMQAWQTTIKPYHEAIIGVIRQHTENIIILGTPHWSQAVDEVSLDPVAGTNLVYAIHFNAALHGSWLRDKVSTALQNGLAVFSSEWLSGEDVQNATVDFSASQLWLDFLQQHSISDVNWAIFDGSEPASALLSPTPEGSGWEVRALSGSGSWVRASLRGERPPPPPCEICAASGQNCKATGCCLEAGMQCYEKDEYFATCKESCEPGINPQDPAEFQTSWTCKALGGACTLTCSSPGANCKDSQCCKDKTLTCFEKDEYFSTCKESCAPGVDAADAAEFQSPWTCAVAAG